MSGVLFHLEGTIRFLEEIFFLLLVIRMIASFLPPRVSGGLWERVVRFSVGLTEPIIQPIRRRMPMMGALDLSPLIALFAVDIAGYLLIQILRLLGG